MGVAKLQDRSLPLTAFLKCSKKHARTSKSLPNKTLVLTLLLSVEVTSYKDTMPNDGPCVFTGRTVFYTGDENVSTMAMAIS